MQIEIHPTAQRTGTGNGETYIEPGMNVRNLMVSVSQISVNLLGSIAIKVQHSPDGNTWFDIANLATGGLTATGAVSVNISSFIAGNYLRLVWTFNNSNSVTFQAYLVGDK